MSSAVTGKGVPVKVTNRSIRLSVLRLVRMAVAFVVVAGSLGLATVTATAQDGGSSCPSDGADNYSDVVAGSTHADNIACLRELGISEAGDTYRPGDEMTRSEMAAFMANAYQALTGEEAPIADHEFTDIADDANADDIARISPNGLAITTGTTDTTYSPKDPVIRGHMALFLTRLYKAVAGSDAPAGDTEFTDIGDSNPEEQAAIGQIFALEVTTGTTPTTYSPSNNVTREQMGSFVARMYRALDALPDPIEAPGAPTGVAVAVSGDDGDALDVSWTAPEDSGTSDVTGYVVQSKSGDDEYSEDNQSSAEDTSANFPDLAKGDTYTFRVAAVSDDGQSDWSDEASATIPEAPGAPTGVEVAISGEDGDVVDVSWTAPEDSGTSDVTGYVVQWKSGDDDYSESLVADTSADLGAFTKGDTYTFRVAAVSDDGQSDWSDEASATIPADPGVPTGVEVAISGDAGDALDVSWTAPEDSGTSGVTGYVVQSKSGDDEYSEDNQISAEDTSANFPDLTQGDTYTFRVAAVSDDGQSDWSDEGSGNPAVAPGLVGELTSSPGNSTLDLSWTAPADDGGSAITGYVVSWRTGRQPSADTADLAGHVTEYTITGLSNALTYSVWVAAVNAAGTGEPASVPAGTASESFVRPKPTESTAPQNVTVTQSSSLPGTALAVSWTAPADDGGTVLLPTDSYTVQYRCGGESMWSDPGVSVTAVATMQVQNAEIPDLMTGNACEVRVRANSFNETDDPADGQQVGDEPTLNSLWAEGSGTPVTLPGAPGFEADDVTTAHQSLQITWDAPAENGGSDITGYKVMWTAGIPAEATVPAEPRMYTITGLDNQYDYSITIKTITAVGESDASQSVTGNPDPRPAAPTNVQAVVPPQFEADGTTEDNNGMKLDVTWNAPPSNGTSAVTSYNVQYQTSAIPGPVSDCPSPVTVDDDGACDAGLWSTAVPVAATMTTTTLIDLMEGLSYNVRVQAVNLTGADVGPGPYGHGSGTPATLPGEVASLTTVAEPGYTSLSVTWVEPADGGSDITHYLVRYARDVTHNEPYSSDMRVNAPLTRVNLTGLAVGIPYVIQIQAVNGIGTGPNTGDGTLDDDLDDNFTKMGLTGLYPSAPASVTAVPKAPDEGYAGTGTMLTVTWSKVTQTNGTGPVFSYTVEVLDMDAQTPSWVPTPVTEPTDTTVDVSNVTRGNTYLVRVRANAGQEGQQAGSHGYLAGTVKAAGVPVSTDHPGAVVAEFELATRTINVTWVSVPEMELDDTDITKYVVTWSNTTDPVMGSRGSRDVSGAGTGEYTITGLNTGTYSITVQAVNHVGKSTAVTVTETVPAPVPS